ncbi:MAG: DUF11 domain-containing protein [Verrucomicrobiales bacterium]|nr:DUF11 domain-containing protein [Verrucomicrobiales bacterium]
MSLTWQHLCLALVGVVVAAAADVVPAVPGNGALTVSVARRDLRPLPGVSLQLSGAADRQGVTDDNGQASFPDLLPAGAVVITPSRSGFRFEPSQLTIPDFANPPAAAFVAFPTATDLELTMVTAEAAPLVGGLVHGVIKLRNLGTEAATDVAVGVGSLPGLDLEDVQATQGGFEYRALGILWRLPQLDPGASAEVNARSRATLPDANVLTAAVIEEMDQMDLNPLDNSAVLITRPRPAQARVSLAMTIDPATAKIGETVPVRLTVRNDGPNDATQVAIRCYLPPGASLERSTHLSGLVSKVVLPRLEAGAQVELGAAMRVRIPGTFTLIANITYMEQALPPGAAWPEARAVFTVQPAFSRLTLFGFTDPPNPRVGDDVNVSYVVRNDGPDAVTGLQLYTREDPRLGLSLTADPNHPIPPVPGPFVFGEVLPVGAYTYLAYRYSVKADGDLTNYFAVQYQDQFIPDAGDHPELFIPIKTLPADVGLSLDALPKELTLQCGEPVTIEFPVHNDGPQPARGLFVNFEPPGLVAVDLDEVIYPDRVERPTVAGYIDVLQPGETVRVRKFFIGSVPGLYTNIAEIINSRERPDLLSPIATEAVRVQVQPCPPPDLTIAVNVDKPQVNVGEYAIFIVTIVNRAAQPALGVWVHEPDAVETDSALETVRSYGPSGDDRISSASQRWIPRIEPGASFSLSRTMRVRKPGTIAYFAKIEGVNGLLEWELPPWRATTEVTGLPANSDIALSVVADRTNVKNGDLVNFAIVSSNPSRRIASHANIVAGGSAGFQMLGTDLGSYGYFFDTSRPQDQQVKAEPLTEWREIRALERGFSFVSAYTVGAGRFSVGAQRTQLDQLDTQPNNDVAAVEINSAPASARVSLRQSIFPQNAGLGDFVLFVTEVRNEGPDRVTGLRLVEEASTNLELNYSGALNGVSGDVATSFLDSLVRLPPLEPGQNFVWQRTYHARTSGPAWQRVRVAGFDQTALGPLPESEAALTVQPARADLELQLLDAPTVAQESIPMLIGVRVRNLGPAVATGVKVAVNLPADALRVGGFEYGPRAWSDLLASNGFQTQLLPGESARVDIYITPTRTGQANGFISVQQSDQIDPNPANNEPSLTLDVAAAPPLPPILRVRKVRTDFFDQTPIAEIEIDGSALYRLDPLRTLWLEGSSNLGDWEFLTYAGFLGSRAHVTFTDHATPGAAMRAYRLRTF